MIASASAESTSKGWSTGSARRTALDLRPAASRRAASVEQTATAWPRGARSTAARARGKRGTCSTWSSEVKGDLLLISEPKHGLAMEFS